MMTHWKNFSKKNSPMRCIPQNDQRIVGIILSHVCWGTLGPPPSSPVGPLGVPDTGAEKGGGSGRGARENPPPRAQSQFSPTPKMRATVPWASASFSKPHCRCAFVCLCVCVCVRAFCVDVVVCLPVWRLMQHVNWQCCLSCDGRSVRPLSWLRAPSGFVCTDVPKSSLAQMFPRQHGSDPATRATRFLALDKCEHRPGTWWKRGYLQVLCCRAGTP